MKVLILTLVTYLLMSHHLSLFLRDSISPIPNILPTIVNQIDIILDDEVIMTRKYLVLWKGRASNDDSWKYQSALQQINPNRLK